MINLALNADKGHLLLKDIAKEENVSEKYLSLLAIPLKSNGLINTFRGAKGGFTLSRPASQIKVKDIVEPLEGDLAIIDCAKEPSKCDRSSLCVSAFVWKSLGDKIAEFLDLITLEDLANMRRGKGAEYNI